MEDAIYQDVKQEKEDEHARKIKVTKLPEETTEDSLMNFFENRRRNGGGPIEDIEYHPATSSAIIEFQEAEVARRVAERQHQLSGCNFDVKLYEPPKHKSANNLSKIYSNEPQESVPHCTIEVSGVTKTMNRTILQLYFENYRKSGGDEIVNVEDKEENELAYITYESEEVAQRVVMHGQHKVEGQPLEVKLYIPPPPKPTYTDRVLLAGLTNKVTCDRLTNFLEARIGLTPKSFLFNEERDKVIITFDEVIDFQKLEEVCKKRTVDGSHLRPSKVQVSNCILVLNLKLTTTKDTIELYFENVRRSWGGPIEKVDFRRDEDFCLVYFEDYTVCDQVLKRKHKIDGSEIQASIFYECLGRISEDDNGPSFKMSKPTEKMDSGDIESIVSGSDFYDPEIDLVVKNITGANLLSDEVLVPATGETVAPTSEKFCVLKLLIKYVKSWGKDGKDDTFQNDFECSFHFLALWNFYNKRDCGHKLLEAILEKYHCRVSLPKDTLFQGSFLFQIFDQTFHKKSGVKQFVQLVLDAVHKNAEKELSIKTFTVDPRLHVDILETVRQTKELDCVWIEFGGEQGQEICMVCQVEHKMIVTQRFSDIVKATEECFKNHEETVSVDFMWQRVMVKFGYLEKVNNKFPNLKINWDESNNVFVLKGPRDEARTAANTVLEILGTAQHDITMLAFSPGCQLEIFTHPEMCDYINSVIPQVDVAWSLNQLTKKIHLFAKKPKQLHGIDKAIKGCVQEKFYPKSKDSSKRLATREANRCLEELMKQYTGILVIQSSTAGLLVTTADDIYENVDATIREILSREGGADHKVQETEEQVERDIPPSGTAPEQGILLWNKQQNLELQSIEDEKRCLVVCDVDKGSVETLRRQIAGSGVTAQFVYPYKSQTALVICKTQEEKDVIMNNLKNQYTFKSVGPQALQGFTTVVHPVICKTVIKMNQVDDMVASVQQNSGVTISWTGSSIYIYAITSHQLDLAQNCLMRFAKNTLGIDLWKESGEIENLERIENVSQTEALASKPLQLFSKLTQELIRRKQKVEITYEPQEKEKLISALEETKLAKLLLVWDDDNKQVLVYSDNYEDLKKLKHIVDVRMGRKKLTGRKGNRFDKQEDAMSLPIEEDTPSVKKFTWSQDARNFEEYKTMEGIVVKVYKADILRLDVDCIVNAANENLQHGGGVAWVIAKAAGPEIDREGREILETRGLIKVGEQCVTTAGNLPYVCVIHTVGPRWSDYYPHDAQNIVRCENDLFNSIIGCFAEAEILHLKSIALPAISSKIFAVPRDMRTEQYVKAVIEYSKTRTSRVLQEIHFIDVSPETVKDMQLAFRRHLSADGNNRNIGTQAKERRGEDKFKS